MTDRDEHEGRRVMLGCLWGLIVSLLVYLTLLALWVLL